VSRALHYQMVTKGRDQLLDYGSYTCTSRFDFSIMLTYASDIAWWLSSHPQIHPVPTTVATTTSEQALANSLRKCPVRTTLKPPTASQCAASTPILARTLIEGDRVEKSVTSECNCNYFHLMGHAHRKPLPSRVIKLRKHGLCEQYRIKFLNIQKCKIAVGGWRIKWK
jgi:hypothetical protein